MEKNNDKTSLSKREFEIMEKVVRGKYNKEIAVDLNLKFNTVRKHLQNIYPKLRVNNRTEASIKFMEITGKLKLDPESN
jgi:DNA-binding NarL/FixJ family response regulator